jgi:hypothetical protein
MLAEKSVSVAIDDLSNDYCIMMKECRDDSQRVIADRCHFE